MNVTWVNPCFRDYRIPVYRQLDRLTGNCLTVIFSDDRTPRPVALKLRQSLGSRAVGLRGEWRLNLGADNANFANVGLRIPYQRGLLRAITSSQPDVVISEGFFQWTPAVLVHKLVHGTPLVVAYERTAHTERHAGFFRTRYRRGVVRLVDAIACNGRLSKQYCVDNLKVPAARVVTGAMAADTGELARSVADFSDEARRTTGRELRLVSPVFLYVGRLIRLKGLHELLAAWSRSVNTTETPGTLLLVGDGPERTQLERRVKEAQLPNVVFAGSTGYDDVPRFFAVADVLVMPTLEDNWSLVVPEAMACGLPILCSRYNGCWPELIHENENGWVFDPRDARQFADLLQTVRQHAIRLPAMGNKSRQLVDRFSPESAAGAVLDACEIATSAKQRKKACNPSVLES